MSCSVIVSRSAIELTPCALRALGKGLSLSMPRTLATTCSRIALRVEDRVDQTEGQVVDIGADKTSDAMVELHCQEATTNQFVATSLW